MAQFGLGANRQALKGCRRARCEFNPEAKATRAQRDDQVRELRPATGQLPIGKTINQIAKSLNAMHGRFRNTDTKNLQVLAQAVREHVEHAARVVSTIRALVTPHKEKP